MATFKLSLQNMLLLCSVLFSVSCSATNTTPAVHLTGSTPGDAFTKTALSIPAATTIDFIRWNLVLDEQNLFVLDINYGESQPNTLGFVNGGEKKTIKGSFTVSSNTQFTSFYTLTGTGSFKKLQIAKLNENIFHLLDDQAKLLVGNGGWSYSLNRKDHTLNDQVSMSSSITDSTSLQMVYEGRTPCQEILKQYPETNARPSCFKIKWKLVLNRDTITHEPTSCAIRNIVDNQPRDVTGTWEIIQDSKTVIYKIQPGNLSSPILLLAGDDDVLLFLDKDKKPLIGNQDFSFTMNRRTAK